ncbi:hypothetical protein BD309DRAFT_534571 [Dichomitus squalens]|uniref:Uncharacterized protein n=1 Tax=Dichomitus squalens TaxID=114155 RepID=A0A4Q9NYX7_9APHY|nr:hypothetical protein BD309DRAFT_534571 [Dichomitus squalens]TBU60777.1 hypothetical protein BD310DRAFT_266632 [Dichomitus squalens]
MAHSSSGQFCWLGVGRLVDPVLAMIHRDMLRSLCQLTYLAAWMLHDYYEVFFVGWPKLATLAFSLAFRPTLFYTAYRMAGAEGDARIVTVWATMQPSVPLVGMLLATSHASTTCLGMACHIPLIS